VVAAATADSRYQLQLVASTGVYGPQRADGAITFSRVRIEIPTVDPSAVAEAGGETRLRVGSVFGRLPRGRRLRVAVSASPATTVVVRLRDGRRRVLGRSKATRVGRRTVVTVKLTRRLRRPGTYELEATGTGVGAGRSVRLR
jgi:hypothetical protein